VHPLTKIVLAEFTQVLKPEGFRKQGMWFWNKEPGAIRWVNAQSSVDTTAECLKFTVNLGAYLPQLAEALGDWPMQDWNIKNGHWKVRLGSLMPGPDDHWWIARDPEQAAATGKEVAGLVRELGLPAMQKAGTIVGLLDFYETTGIGTMYAGSRYEEVVEAIKKLAAGAT
jgi:hypothetical protein